MHWKSIINTTEYGQEIIFTGPNFLLLRVLPIYMCWDHLENNILI